MNDKPIDLISRFVSLRSDLRDADKTYAAFKKEHYDDPMEAIEMQLLDLMNQTGVDSFKTKKGTAYKKKSTSLTTADASEWRRHVIGGELWDLIEFRPSKSTVVELIEGGQGVPPGLNYSTSYNVHVNKPSEESK